MRDREAARGRSRARRWLVLRRLVQGSFLLLFLTLFIITDSHGDDRISAAVNLLFRIDPFLALCVMLGVKAVVALMLPALAVLLLSLVFGRAFCGWVCPMGALLDLSAKVVTSPARGNRTLWPGLPLALLVFLVVAAAAGFSLAGLLDPFSLLVRGLAQALHPMFHLLNVEFFTFTYRELPPAVNVVTEPLYQLLRDTVLPAEARVFHLASLSLVMLLAVLLLERVHRRFFCRNLCPLGAMLGLVARFSALAGQGGDEDCGACRLCATGCRMGAIDEGRAISAARCNLCYSCANRCPRGVIRFSYGWPSGLGAPLSLSRRRFLGLSLLAVAAGTVKRVEAAARVPDPLLIRPPGALAERDFLARCVRCGECIKVCIGNALQPAFLQAGLDGMFSPVVVARIGYCEYNCTLCGQVCPSAAIVRLSREEKQRLKIGHAWFDHDTCLPYAKNTPCMVCEEHCPVPEKAIRFRTVTVSDGDGLATELRQPYVVDHLCIGCGICETKCPLPGRSAIVITRAGEHRHGEALPWKGAGQDDSSGYGGQGGYGGQDG